MDNLFQSKWFVGIISLVFAISLFLYVDYESNPGKKESSILPGTSQEVHTLEDVPLEVRMDTDQYVVSGVPEYIKVSLEGKTTILTRLIKQNNFTFFVDLTDYDEGEHFVEIEYENIPDDLTVYIEPKTIEVLIERRATKEFAVEIDFVNLDKLPIGYELGEPEVTPETVTIVSSESVLEKIAIVKVYVDVTDLKESIHNREVPVSVSDIQGNDLNVRVEPAGVTISVPVERPSKRVPLNIATKGELPEGFHMQSMTSVEEVDIFGRRDVLNEIDEIFTKEIDLSTIEESGVIEVEVNIPENTVMNKDTVEVMIELEQEKLFEDIPITIKGQGNKNVTFIQPNSAKLAVIAIGNDQLIKELNNDDITASIEVRNLRVREYRVNI